MSFTKTLTIEMLVIMGPTLERQPLPGLLLGCGRASASPHMNTKQPGMCGAPASAYRVWKARGLSPTSARNRLLNEPRLEKPDRVAHLGDGEVRRAQQVLGSLDPPLRDVLGRGEAVGRLEEPEEVVLRQARRRREPLEVERLRVLPVGEVARAAQVREDVVGRSHAPGRHAAIVRHLREDPCLLETTDPPGH